MARDEFHAQNAPELYVRGKLDREQAEAFEAHLLDCDRCFGEVELAERYVSGLKSLNDDPVLAETDEDRPERLRRWTMLPRPQLIVATATVVTALVAVLALWQITRDDLLEDESRHAVLVAAWGRHGDRHLVPLSDPASVYRDAPVREDATRLSRDPDGTLAVFFALPSDTPAAAWVAELRDLSGGTILTDLGPHDAVDDGIHGVLIDAAELDPGTYRLVISTGDVAGGTEVGAASFRLVH